ncbi:uncharacterized protein MELLADRAFT_69648 [Melampsora larici-populina 98AG31]|uniref:Uncharacterized protein n=1 Tax=Melampsora larici-populina (strain 98AG31 / pathotype 3-4-7) TaxID=747676 RepID=F4SBK9_MELLP|nr:uncharacterized protein MELLADRAFT_69648 [Melampsora larici-populina 98AG31]EGF97972.1 hypothetical protein MELLADRAFT_69648 [Melampsora larici-populina 98AG31]
MGKKGTAVHCPLGGAKKKRRTKEDAEGSAIIADQVDTSEAQYVNKRLIEIENALNAVQEPLQVDAQPNQHHNDLQDNNNIVYGDAYDDINNFLPAQEDAAVPPDPNVPFATYVQGSFYRSKKKTENENWKKALPDMFITYMTYSQETSQWGDPTKWNYDHNKPCCCGVGDLRMCKVDMLDILGER